MKKLIASLLERLSHSRWLQQQNTLKKLKFVARLEYLLVNVKQEHPHAQYHLTYKADHAELQKEQEKNIAWHYNLPLWRQPSDLSKKPQPLESLDLTYAIKLAYSGMPFWKVTGDGNSKDYRFVGVLEANSIEPAHDKHDFERSVFVFEARDETKTDAKGLLVRYSQTIKCNFSGHVLNPRPDLSVSQTGSRDRTVFNNDRPIVQDPPGFDTLEEGIDYDEVFSPVARIEAIRLFLAFASYMGFTVYQMDVKSAFLYCTIREEVYVQQPLGFLDPGHPNKVYKVQQPDGIFISQDKYVVNILKKFDFCSIRTATTPIESNKPLVQDEDGMDVDVHVYRSMIGSLMYLTTSRPDIMFVVCACARRLISWKCKKQIIVANSTTEAEYVVAANCYGQHWDVKPAATFEGRNNMDLRMDGSCASNFSHIWGMTTLKYSDKHNMVAFLKKPNESMGFTEIVDFLNGTSLRYALTHNPTIYDSIVKQFWQTATVRTLVNGTLELVTSINNKEYTIIEASVRSKLQLADASGISNLPNAEIYDGLATLRGNAGDYVPLLPAMLAGAAEDQADEATTTGVMVGTEGATTTTSGLDAGLDSGNIHESPLRSHKAPLHEGHTSESVEDSLQLKVLMVLVPKLVTRIANLEKELHQTKTTYGKAVLTLVERVKSLEVALKRKTKKAVVFDLEDEETKNQGWKIQDIDDDPLVSLVRESMKEKDTDFVISHKAKSSDKGIRYKRKTRSKSIEKDISTDLDTDIEVNPGSEDFNTGNEDFNTVSLGVSTGSVPVSTPSIVQTINVTIPSPIKSQREGKALMTTEEIQATKRTKAQIQQEEAAEVQEVAQYYTEEDWDTIRAKLKANAELTKSLQGEIITSEDFAKRIVEMINQKKKFYAEQKAKARRSKPMTRAQQRDYMSTFIKNQSSWKLNQLKKLTFDELKTKFEKLVKSIENFMPMETDERVKRQGVQLEQEFSKKQKTIEEVSVLEESIKEPVIAKEEEIEKSVRREDKSEEAREAFMKDKVTSVSSESKIRIDDIPTATKPPSIVDWKIIPQSGLKAVYQIIRRDGSDKIYISFGAILKDFSRDGLIELYKLVIKKYGVNRPEEIYDIVL
ncbi:putative ribonuclease H-like domain-containing protein [Tanacetum coccineum]|uniref:Ribonuclease H-like domain-containing protein n=1 Tax=Tanacetum coccineum TaxID=301880 RepID=A0ABQ4WDN6_9ASTR